MLVAQQDDDDDDDEQFLTIFPGPVRSGAWPWKRNNGRLGAFN